MRKSLALLFVTLMALLLTGCLLYRGNDWDLYKMIIWNVPNTLGIEAPEAADTKIIETDVYGRRLFTYEMNRSGTTGYDRICIYAICQKADREYVYYYEDFCFILSSSLANFTQEDIEQLKSVNGWGEPIDEAKLSKHALRAPMTSHKEGIDANEIFNRVVFKIDDIYESLNSFPDNLNPETGTTLLVDSDEAGNQFYYVYVYNDQVRHLRSYFMMLKNDGSYDPEIFIEEIDDLYQYQEQMHEFKIRNGWVFS